jgi:hypothetical protein
MKKPIPNIKTPCRFCGVVIWAPADCREPECDECEGLWSAVQHDSLEIEGTLEPITECAIYTE